MYTHARQFPHFAGMSDAEIRAIAKRAVAKNPGCRFLRKLQILIAAILLSGTIGLSLMFGAEIGIAFVLAGFFSTIFIVGWNFVWVNTTLFRITREEVGIY